MSHPNFPFERLPAPLISWYNENKRDLPWRKNPTPYRVWVSEIMLQQTRVEAVIEYYLRFMQALPTIEDLATCEEEKLLKLWEGLGYYSRVRNLQKAAKEILFSYGGKFPDEKEQLQKLPGIGSYTAGAIASIAFGRRTAAVDGNVFRVISRLSMDETPISAPEFRIYLEDKLSAVYPQEGEACAQFTQSLFELGAVICKPKNPDCSHCPLSALCKANARHTQLVYPVKKPQKEKRAESLYVFLIQTPQGFAIRRREEGVLRGMNEFPSHIIDNGESAHSVLNEWGMYEFNQIKRGEYRHIFTHIRWEMTCVWVETENCPFDVYTLEEIEENISLPTAFKQCLDILQKENI